MIEYILLQPEGVLPVEGAGGLGSQSIGFQDDHPPPPPSYSHENSIGFQDDHPPPPPPK